MLECMYTLEGPRGWAVWFVFVPQMILLSTVFVAAGEYMMLECYSRIMALLLMARVVISALLVGADISAMGQGLLFNWPSEPQLYVILAWVGTILAGSMGIVWFGYWTATRGFGCGLVTRERDDETPVETRYEPVVLGAGGQSENTRLHRIRECIGVMSGTATLGVLGGLLVIASFMVLGAELLAPEGKLPEGADVAVDLSILFFNLWGSAGEHLLLAAIIIALGGSVLANQDGWGRSFADLTLILTRGRRDVGKSNFAIGLLNWLEKHSGLPMFERRYLKRLFVASITGIAPIGIIRCFEDPVAVMSASGIIAVLHTPFIALTALYINRTCLPADVRPGWFVTLCMGAAGLFCLGFAVAYLWGLAVGGG